jgi:hypothetical protein
LESAVVSVVAVVAAAVIAEDLTGEAAKDAGNRYHHRHCRLRFVHRPWKFVFDMFAIAKFIFCFVLFFLQAFDVDKLFST